MTTDAVLKLLAGLQRRLATAGTKLRDPFLDPALGLGEVRQHVAGVEQIRWRTRVWKTQQVVFDEHGPGHEGPRQVEEDCETTPEPSARPIPGRGFAVEV